MPVKIKGKDYPIRPTMWALLQFKRDKGKRLSEIGNEDQEDFIYYTWLCVRGACMQEGISFEMSFEDYILWVEGDPVEILVSSEKDKDKDKTKKKTGNL